ncbi:MAG: NmrA family NAD(P)-binding protein [Chitinophaga sp.]|uniref:NmrA family NAD(P)-binding protein n=1 Tax=Chitinophaga sp. TaxID=1869181 RepID=UPI0025C25328|nr:NmrA family NAD(P)-binding protein [Chitinophaga sp.]MBV8253090.1 NmrA family NAD(P)-binding protein [Chitinophaga sp.]
MKIIITGSIGNVSKPLAVSLLAQGHEVRIITSNPSKAAAITALGATPAIGSLDDQAFLLRTFSGADAAYLMCPPKLNTDDYIHYVSVIARNYAAALQQAGVKRAVVLSSMGAHRSEGHGPIAGIHQMEKILSEVKGTAITFLRAAFFYNNFFGNIPMVHQGGIIGNNYPADSRLIMVHPTDIAKAVAEELLRPSTGTDIRYAASDERTAGEIATILGKAVGIDALPWVNFEDDAVKNVLLGNGFSLEMATRFVEIGVAVRSKFLWEEYDKTNKVQGIRLEDFAQEFAARFHAPVATQD